MVIGNESTFTMRVAQVRWRVDQRFPLLDVEKRCVKVRKEPFVHVRVEGIEGDEVGGVMLVFRKDERGAGVGGVNVSPDGRVVGDDCGDACKIVYGAGGRCAYDHRYSLVHGVFSLGRHFADQG